MVTRETMEKVPNIVTPPPGPRSRALLEERSDVVPPGVYLVQPVSITESMGAVIRDVDGNVYIDFTSGIGVVSLARATTSGCIRR